MQSMTPMFLKAGMVACLSVLGSQAHAAQNTGQDFPNSKCTCKGCGANKGDVTGQCATVCKDKTVYDKGSESYDYCKAAARVKRLHDVRPDATKAPVEARP